MGWIVRSVISQRTRCCICWDTIMSAVEWIVCVCVKKEEQVMTQLGLPASSSYVLDEDEE